MAQTYNRSKRRNHPKQPPREGFSKYHLKHRADMIAEIIRQYPDQIARGLAEREEASWLFGCLYLVGAISRDQLSTAEQLDKVTRSFLRCLKKYGHLVASDPSHIPTSSHEDLSKRAEGHFRRVKEQYEGLHEILEDCGEGVVKAIEDVLRKETLTDLRLVRKGLTAIAIGKKRRAGRRPAK